MVKVWMQREDADTSGLTFGDWDPDEGELEGGEAPAAMIINSSELRGVGSLTGSSPELMLLLPAQLEDRGRGRMCTRSAAVREAAQSVGPRRVLLRSDVDNVW